MNSRRIVACLAFAYVLTAFSTSASQAQSIGFSEDFALADDRSEVLKQLIPGTEQYYYFHCLHFQNTGQFARIDEMLEAWVKNHGETRFVKEIQHRQALLTYERSPEKSLEFIRRELNLHFNHQRQVVNNQPDLLSSLNQDVISRTALTEQAFRRSSNTDSFEDAALHWLMATDLNPIRRRHLLERLTRPDHESLPALVVADLRHEGSRGFGSLTIHRLLTQVQMDECLELHPSLLVDTNFAYIYLSKLQPNPDVDWRTNDEAFGNYLQRLWSYVSKLPPAFNSLKAHVLYHQLVHDRSNGNYDRDRFMSYLRLPRQTGYVNPDYLQDERNRRYIANLGSDFRQQTLLPPVGNDEPLVRSYLHHFFVDENNFQSYAQLIRDTYLKKQFAETKIVNGIGDQEEWYAMLSPTELQALRDRVDIEFAHTNPEHFAANDTVTLDLSIKNVDNLIVKIFEINTHNFYRETLREISTDISLDGLVANDEQTHEYTEPALRRVSRRFEFPQLKQAGVYVVDFIGNGKSSRIVVRKGKFRHLVASTIAGQRFTILDEQNQHVDDAVIWMGGREYQADEDGSILIPFTNQPSRQPIVISRDGQSTLDYFQHQSENYSLQAGFYVDREALLARHDATLLVRTALELNGNQITHQLLEDVKLVVTSTDLEGISTSREVTDFELSDSKESEFEFQVPDRMSHIAFQLVAKVPRVTQRDEVTLSQSQTFAIRQIDRVANTEDIHFRAVDGEYLVELLGKTGEAIAGRALQIYLKPNDFRFNVPVTLKTNESGRVSLGALEGISSVQVVTPQGINQTFALPKSEYSYYNTLHAGTGQSLHVPYVGSESEATRAELSLLELRGNTFVADHFDALTVNDGMIVIDGLPAGDYDLLIKSANQRIKVRVTDGELEHDYLLGDHRQLEVRVDQPFHIVKTELEEEELVIQTANSSLNSRIHVFGTSFVPPFSVYNEFSQVNDAEPFAVIAPNAKSMYVAGRKIGDEYQYILDRRYARRFPGNTLERPSLLLNPFALRTTETDTQVADAGEEYDSESDGATGSRSQSGNGQRVAEAPVDFSNLDFLAEPTRMIANLVPDENGEIKIPWTLLENHSEVRVVAVDRHGVSSRDIPIGNVDRLSRDLRLTEGLDPDKHYTQQKQVSLLSDEEQLVVDDISTARFQSYSTLGDVYRLYLTLSSNPQLAEFSFILDWNEKSLEDKNELYSKYACHELNFFLLNKDPAFFDEVVRPYLGNKKDQTYLDHWLLKAELSPYRRPWSHARLNVVERILLGMRMPIESEPTRRHVEEMYELSPTTRDTFNVLFQYAIQSNSLDTEDALGWESAQSGQAADGLYRGYGRPSSGERSTEAADPFAANSAGGLPALQAEPQAEGSESSLGYSGRLGRGRGLGDDSNNGTERELLRLADNYLEADMDSLRGNTRFSEQRLQEQMDLSLSLEKRKSLAQLYQPLETTKEWAENNYYKIPIESQVASLVDVNRFWMAYANHDPDSIFFSEYFPEAAGNFTEMMFALAVLDLPVEMPEHESEFTDRTMTLTASGPLVAFHEEIKPVQWNANTTPILVSQNFFRVGDRYYQQGGERFDKFVTDEFLTHTAYGCQVVVTNPTSSRQKIDVLTQIPVGALPINSSKETKSVAINLEPYNTQSVEYFFYFPAEGDFPQYPVHVARDEELVAFAEPTRFNVVNELTNIDRESWAYVSQFGTGEDVITFLNTHNLLEIDLSKIAFRMQDEDYFERVVALVQNRHAFDYTLWSYGIKHDQVDVIREFLQYSNNFVNLCGTYLDSPLLTIDPVIRHAYQHLEYRPLINARAHRLGAQRRILNDRFFAQYQRLLTALSYHESLSDDALMAVTYYMLLQDRIEEAIKYFQRVNPDRLQTRIQYDYFAAYLDMFSDEPNVARQLAQKYSGHPVDRWRNAFQSVLAQLDEIEGGETAVVDDEDRTQTQTQLASDAPSFDFDVESNKIEISYANVNEIQVNYYIMDIELLFSRNPFVQQYSGQFSFIRPNMTQSVALPSDQSNQTIELPEELHTSNVLVEISAAGTTKSQAYYSNALDVQINESYAMLRVTHDESSRPIPKTYVKTYARMKDGSVRFYKDGYTDLRGRFDFGSLSTNELDFVDRFSVLIYSDDHGAVVREVAPPQQ